MREELTKREGEGAVTKKNKLAVMLNLMFFLLIFSSLFLGKEAFSFDGTQKSFLLPAATSFAKCPSNDFDVFLKKFTENIEVQRAFTGFPLEKLSIVDAHGEPKLLTEFLKREQIFFPLVPDTKKRELKNIDIWVDHLTDFSAEITLRNRSENYKSVSLFFTKDVCWKLTKIEDWFFPSSIESSWLINIFPRIKACTPTELFYEKNKKKSANQFLESKGYKNPSLDLGEQFATYTIKEKFFGFEAVELSIPSAQNSITTIKVRAKPENLAKKISSVMGINVPIFKEGLMPSAEAYIVKKDANFSLFVCSTFEE